MAEQEFAPVNRFKKFAKNLRYSYRSLPDKKQYVEFFTAVLSVPVLLTVIILNVNNLNSKKDDSKDTKDVAPIVVTVPAEKSNSVITQTTSAACEKGIGPISISSPAANEVVEDNPVQITIDYEQGNYCAVVWAYSINGGRFSEYSSNSIALYNPPSGSIRFQLKVKSVVNGEEKILNRSFSYQGPTTAPTTTPVASGSAN
ncbi:MAG: hypothetical protein KBC15_01050 [Candidatus Levybacteria bacterium]|nr:hypothetical protein [Candidatus Levybacteria bacterium]